MMFRVDGRSDVAIEIWESRYIAPYFPKEEGFPGWFAVNNAQAIFMPKTIQVQNTFKDRFFVDIARGNVFIVQLLDSFVQKPGVPEVLDILQFFEYT